MVKKIIRLTRNIMIFSLIINLLCLQAAPVLAQQATNSTQSNGAGLRGSVELDNEKQDQNIFTGKTQEIQKGTQLKMTVSSVLSTGYNAEGDEFFAEITNDLPAQDGIVIPSGTIAHGTVTKIRESKRLGRDAYLSMKFDYLITPDGRQIPIEASMTTKRSAVASTAKVILEDTGYTVAGGLIGGFLALKFLGLGTAIASHGYTLAGGAGVGALVGATASLARKGGEALIAPGDEIRVQVLSKMQLPVMTEDSLKDEEKQLDGLNVKIVEYAIVKDPFGEPNTISLTLDIDNRTNKTFTSFDMALVNDYNSVFYPSPFGETELWFQKIVPNSKTRGKMSFAVDNPKKKHWLIFFDTMTRKPLAKISVKNAERRLKKEKTSKK